MNKENKYYVYIYLDPRKKGNYSYMENGIGISFDYEPFYIGEGQNGRRFDHLNQAKNLKKNSPKIQKIRKIWKSGLKPIIYKIFEFKNEQDALNVERVLGFIVGRKDLNEGPLTNLVDLGQKTTRPSEESKRRRKQLYIDDPDKKKREVERAKETRSNKTEEEKKETIYRYRQTLADNPKITIDKKHKLKEFHQTNPEVGKERAQKRLENETKEIKDQRIDSYKKKLESDPSINTKRGENISKAWEEKSEEDKNILRKKRSEERLNESEEKKKQRTDNLHMFYELNPEKKRQEVEKSNQTKANKTEEEKKLSLLKLRSTLSSNPQKVEDKKIAQRKTKNDAYQLKLKCIKLMLDNNIQIEYHNRKWSIKYWETIEQEIYNRIKILLSSEGF